MKRKNNFIVGIASVLAFFMTLAGCASAASLTKHNPLRTEDTPKRPYTLDGTITGGTSYFATESDITQNGISWKVTGNTQQNPWRIGGNTLTNVDRPIYSQTAMPFDINKIDITFGTATSITVNSLRIDVYSAKSLVDAGGQGDVAYFTPSFVASDVVTINKADSTSWENCFYRININVTVSGGTNRFVQFSSVTFSYVEAGSYTVSFNSNGGTPISPQIVSDSGEEVISEPSPAPTKDGYTFAGWYSDVGLTTPYNFSSPVTDNLTLYAKWNVIKYTDQANRITWNMKLPTYDSMSSSSAAWSSPKATISVAKSTSSSNTNSWCPPAKDSTRFYANSEMTISPLSGFKLDSIVFTTETVAYATTLAGSTWTNASASADSTVVTVTPTLKASNVVVKFGGAVGVYQIVSNYSIYVALDSIAISGTYPTSFTQGDAFSHDGMTITATYENDSQSDVTASATFSGYDMSTPGDQTVTVTYGEEQVTKTATYGITVNAPVVPFILPNKSTTSGYTGLNETLSFDYGNLDSSLSVVSNNISVVTINSPSASAGSGTVQINFVGAGSTTVDFKDGDSVKASVTVTVTASSVAITGLPATRAIFVGGTFDLGSTITVTPVGSYSDDVTWESEDDSIATVNNAGVVTGVAKGTVDIIVTSDDDPGASMTCSITVTRVSFTSSDTLENGKKYIIAAHGSSDPSELFYLPAATTTIDSNPAIYKVDSIAELNEANAWSVSVDGSGHITISNTVNESTYYLSATDAATGIKVVTENPGYWVLDGNGLKHSSGSTRYMASYNDGSFRNYTIPLNSSQSMANVFYEYVPTARQSIERELTTTSSLSYHYSETSGDFTYTNVAIRFGCFMSQTLWNQLDEDLNIQGYGVMLSTVGYLGETTLEANYRAQKTNENTIDEAIALACDGTDVKNFYTPNPSSEKAVPSLATAEQKGLLEGNYYIWNLYKRVLNTDEGLQAVYKAVAYIRVGDDLVFLQETTASAKSLALGLLESGVYDEDDLDGSIYYLAHLGD